MAQLLLLLVVAGGVVTTGTVACDLAVTGGGFGVEPFANLVVVVDGLVVGGTVVVVTTGTVDAGVGSGSADSIQNPYSDGWSGLTWSM